MKVLYISPYRNGSDYTDAAVNYIQALDRVGVDVVPRCIHENKVDIPEKIKELEKKSSEGCTHLIIHGPPFCFEYYAQYKKNIGITAIETDHFRNSTWASKMNLMDEIVVANHTAKIACSLSNVKKPVTVIPYAFDFNKYTKSYEPLHEIKSLTSDFLFYVIARSNKRKNIIDVLRAFHTEFRPEEPVNILLKTGAPNLPTEISRSDMRKICETVKKDLRLYPRASAYKSELIVTEWLKDEQLASLHNTCDCYIAVSSNENWCVPAFEAMTFGKTPIYINYAGYSEYLNNQDNGCGTGFKCSHVMDNCFGFVGNSEIYTAEEQWAKPDIYSLSKTMRNAYRVRTNYPKTMSGMISSGLDKAQEFSYEKIGLNLKELLLDEQQK